MTARVRKLVGGVAIVAFVTVYAAAAVTLVDYVPRFWLLRLAYFLAVGVAWGVPIIPLMAWMNRGR